MLSETGRGHWLGVEPCTLKSLLLELLAQNALSQGERSDKHMTNRFQSSERLLNRQSVSEGPFRKVVSVHFAVKFLLRIRNEGVGEEFPGGLVVRIWYCHCSGPGSVPGWGTETPQAAWHSQKIKIIMGKVKHSDCLQNISNGNKEGTS